MRKWILVFIGCSMVSLFARAQEVLEPAVNESAFLAQKEILVWRTDKVSLNGVAADSCQAVRLTNEWFLTAAHCVYPSCKGTLPCTVEITLAQSDDLREQVQIHHTTASQHVFIYPGFFPGGNRVSSMDVALIQLDPATADYSYEAFSSRKGQWVQVGQKKFEKLLSQSPEASAQLQVASPRLLGVGGLPNVRLLPTIVVPKMTQGVLSYRVNPSDDVFFVRELQHFISPGFGVRPGNSGGGIFTAQGDLVGIVSSLLHEGNSASFQNDKGETLLTLQNARSYFFFTGFDGSTLNFVRSHVPFVRSVGADAGFVKPVTADFSALVKRMNSTPVSGL